MEPNVLLGYPKRGFACSSNLFGREQYPFDSLDKNTLTLLVYKGPNEGITFLVSFVKVTQYFSKF